MKPSDYKIFFEKKLHEMSLSLSERQQDLLLRYLDEMLQWNRVHNLTSIQTPEEMITKHLLDSLAIAPFFSTQDFRIADIGTGAGLPGIPLAVYYPEKEWTLIESSEKKCCFLRHIKGLFGLDQLTILPLRVERCVLLSTPFDVLLSRALTRLRPWVKQTGHLAGSKTRWFAMKGQYPQDELDELGTAVAEICVHRLNVPGLEAARHLVIFKRP